MKRYGTVFRRFSQNLVFSVLTYLFLSASAVAVIDGYQEPSVSEKKSADEDLPFGGDRLEGPYVPTRGVEVHEQNNVNASCVQVAQPSIMDERPIENHFEVLRRINPSSAQMIQDEAQRRQDLAEKKRTQELQKIVKEESTEKHKKRVNQILEMTASLLEEKPYSAKKIELGASRLNQLVQIYSEPLLDEVRLSRLDSLIRLFQEEDKALKKLRKIEVPEDVNFTAVLNSLSSSPNGIEPKVISLFRDFYQEKQHTINLKQVGLGVGVFGGGQVGLGFGRVTNALGKHYLGSVTTGGLGAGIGGVGFYRDYSGEISRKGNRSFGQVDEVWLYGKLTHDRENVYGLVAKQVASLGREENRPVIHTKAIGPGFYKSDNPRMSQTYISKVVSFRKRDYKMLRERLNLMLPEANEIKAR